MAGVKNITTPTVIVLTHLLAAEERRSYPARVIEVTGMARNTVMRVLRRLADDGHARREKNGWFCWYQLTDEAVSWAEQVLQLQAMSEAKRKRIRHRNRAQQVLADAQARVAWRSLPPI